MTKRNAANRIAKRVASLAAALLLLVIGLAGAQSYQALHTVYSTVALDVNPNVEILVNQKDRVLDVIAGNEDGEAVIGGMEFKNASLELTVNALIGSMLKNGYLSDMANTILISMDPGDEAHGQHLRLVLEREIGQTMTENAFGAALLFQEAEKSAELTALADQAGVSLGKAQLASSIAKSNALYSADELAKLSINELNLLKEANAVDPAAVSGSGQASAKAYIGDEDALGKAMAHAGVQAGQAQVIVNMLDYENGRMVYDIEFNDDMHEYDYEIDALTGEVHKAEKEIRDDRIVPAPGAETTEAQLIGGDAAKDAALTHAGLSAGEISGYRCTLDREDARTVYEIGFYVGHTEYDYEIDALTSAVLKAEKELDGDAKRAAEAASDTSQVQPAAQQSEQKQAEYIGEVSAQKAAIAHAGLDKSELSYSKCRLDREDGRQVYEIEFYAGYTEYDYEIDALTGAVLKAEKDFDDDAWQAAEAKKAEAAKQAKDTASAKADEYIGTSAAKSKALSHAGVSSSDAKGLKAELDRDDGRVVYEVEFKAGSYEYDYEIDAKTGSVIRSEKERDD